jgi:hypothetical protein
MRPVLMSCNWVEAIRYYGNNLTVNKVNWNVYFDLLFQRFDEITVSLDEKINARFSNIRIPSLRHKPE